MISVALDTSVYVAALNCRGCSVRLLNLAQRGALRVDSSEPILTEALQILHERFEWEEAHLARLHRILLRITNATVCEDAPGNAVLRCAAREGSDYIATWDQDLLRRATHGRARIVTVPALLTLLGER